MYRLVALAVVLSPLWLTTPAEAGWKMDRAEAIAEIVWKQDIEIAFGDPASVGHPDNAAEWAWEGTNTVYVNPEHSYARYWETFCTAVLHGAGHAATYRDPANMEDPQHSHRADSVMSANQMVDVMSYRRAGSSKVHYRFTGTDRRCTRRGRPYLERHGALPVR